MGTTIFPNDRPPAFPCRLCRCKHPDCLWLLAVARQCHVRACLRMSFTLPLPHTLSDCAKAVQYLSDDVAKYNRSSRRAPLADLFFEEARRHLDAEAWRPSINSIAALYLMYLRECHEGRDRPAVIYRLSAIEMYEQLGLGRLVPDEQSLQDNQEAYLDWRLAFAASWGCFMMEWQVMKLSSSLSCKYD